jgi:histidyl-tRNA synthetase
MYERPDFEPVRGMRDYMPEDLARLIAVRKTLEELLDDWGYRPIDLPILERRELYLKKSGEELVGKLYDFVHSGRSLALRPEWTASVLRAYLKGLQSEPLPVRLRYAGPVFRYERPQRVTYRQFTQVGIELIGGPAPRADAEVIMLAARGLAAAGASDWTLTIGHVGIARALLAGLNLPERTASHLLWSMERLRRGEHETLGLLRAEAPQDTFDLGPLAELPDEQLSELLTATIRAMGLSLESTTRPPEAIVERLIRKLRRADPQPRIQQAVDSLRRLGEARGAPDLALRRAGELLKELGLPRDQLDELHAIIDLVGEQGLESPRLVVDLGMSRGLHYYSGMIFEISANGSGGAGLQLCGGGRYDDLIGALQGSGPRHASVPAVGFAYGLERVAAPVAGQKPMVMVAAPDGGYARAMQGADELRASGYRVLLDVRGRSLQANLRDAERRGCRALVVVGEDAPAGQMAWHEVGAGTHGASARRGPLSELIAAAGERVGTS